MIKKEKAEDKKIDLKIKKILAGLGEAIKKRDYGLLPAEEIIIITTKHMIITNSKSMGCH